MMSDIPAPDRRTPTTREDLGNVVFLKNQVLSPLISAGDYTYYDDEGTGIPFEQAAVKYLYGPQRLLIGCFTTIGPGATFLMPGGNHPMAGPSTYPFTMFGGTWTEQTAETFLVIEQPGDTVIGNDVWIGRDAIVLPIVTIADGAVIGAHSVVTKDVGPYEIVAGNPARRIRDRIDAVDEQVLLELAWWDWPIESITEHAAVIMGGTPEPLRQVAPDPS